VNCRICDSPTVPFLDLGFQPLANHLLTHPDEQHQTYPLNVRLCTSCRLGQLAELVPPDVLFREYAYYSSVSTGAVNPANSLVERAISTARLDDKPLAVEIGSNDGYLLRYYRRWRVRVLGIDPARGPANAAALVDVPTVQEFFTAALARTLPPADIIHANNVLAHVPDLDDFVAGLAILLKPDGVCYVEVPYLGALIEGCQFDTVYHEHAYYFSIASLRWLFLRHYLYLADIEHLPVHGGSLRLTIRKHPESLAFVEEIDGSDTQARAGRVRAYLTMVLSDLRRRGKRVWGYGAAAKATVMLNYCGIDRTLIEAVADETPAKIGRYIPGTGIPIVHPDDWLAAAPDYTCCFAWNFAQVIAHRYARTYPGKWFTPYYWDSLPKEKAS
jgi:SAM-dependent methyltransferase